MSIVFINNTLETFTPTQSGAVATVLWQLCQAARLQGFVPMVLTGNGSAKSYDWPQMLFVDYPRVPASRIGIGLYRLERRLNGWRHLRQRAYGLRVVSVIRKAGMAERPLVLHNDPELAVLLRRFFPNAFLAHHFHNQLECKPKFRAQFRDAVDAVSAVSGFTARWIEGYYGLSAGSAAIIYNGVDSRRFAPAAEPPAGLPVINFVGRTGIEKAPDLLLRAAQRLSEKQSLSASRSSGLTIGTGWRWMTISGSYRA